MDLFVLIVFGIINLIIHFIGAISGGKGLILRPLLIFLGIPIVSVISSSIVAGSIVKIVKIYSFQKFNKIDWKLAKLYFFISGIGGIVGVFFTIYINEKVLEVLLGILILGMGIFLLLNKKIGIIEENKTLSLFQKLYVYPIYFIISILEIIVGGVGSLFSFILIKFHGKSYITASATKTVIHLSTIIASIFFIFFIPINWLLVLVLIISGSIGSYWGVVYGIKKGEVWVKFLTLFVIFISGIKLVFF